MTQEPRHAKSQTDYATEDKTKRVLVRTGLRRKQIALDNALVEQPFRLNGDFLYADNLSTGQVTIKLNNTSEDPIPFTSQSAVEGWPIQDVFISCAAQPGLVLNLWYGWEARIRPPQSVVQLTGNVQLALTAAGAPQGADLIASNNNAFSFNAVVGAGGAGTFALIGIANPNASGKRLYVDVITVLGGAASFTAVPRLDTAAQGANIGNWTSKKSGGGLGTGQIRTGTPGLLASAQSDILQPLVNGFDRRVYSPPFVVDPNTGLYVQCVLANTGMTVAFEGREY